MTSRPFVTIDAVALVNQLLDVLEAPGVIPDDARAQLAARTAREAGYFTEGRALADLSDVIYLLARNQASEDHSVGDVIAALVQPGQEGTGVE